MIAGGAAHQNIQRQAGGLPGWRWVGRGIGKVIWW